MIGKLSGIIDSIEQDKLILDVQGVGYIVFASRRTISRIGPPGEPTRLLIETIIREDAFNLYGFIDVAEKHWFKILTGVQGVGAKAALSILSVCPAEELPVIIAAQDKAMITRADGVGPKLATRIITELKDKTGSVAFDQQKPVVSDIPSASTPATPQTDIGNDAVSALINLGYGRSDAFTAVAKARGKVDEEERNNLQALIRMALKEIAA